MATADLSSLNPPTQALDVQVLEELLGHDSKMIAKLLQGFCSTADVVAAELCIACHANDLASVCTETHKLKSSTRSVGAMVLGDWCTEIAHACAGKQEQKVKTLFPLFKAELKAVFEQMGYKRLIQ